MCSNPPTSSNNYQFEESETWIGEWLEQRGVRDEMVIATKYTTGFRAYKGTQVIQSNFVGNNTKSMRVSVEASLKKLRTSYIDLVSDFIFFSFCLFFISGMFPHLQAPLGGFSGEYLRSGKTRWYQLLGV